MIGYGLTFQQHVPVFDRDFDKTGWLCHRDSYVFHPAFGADSDRAIEHRWLLQEGVAHVIADLIVGHRRARGDFQSIDNGAHTGRKGGEFETELFGGHVFFIVPSRIKAPSSAISIRIG